MKIKHIEGGIHAATKFWNEHSDDDETGFLLIDARNAFNEMNRARMLFEIRFSWPRGARFIFNCYKHWGCLTIKTQSGESFTLHSKEGVTQGDPLSMMAYGIGTLPIIQSLHCLKEKCLQLWYADDASLGGKFEAISKMFRKLCQIGPKFGYYPEPSKCTLVVHPLAIPHATNYFKDMGFQISSGCRFLGGHIGTDDLKSSYVTDKVTAWATAIEDLSSIAKKYPQTSYCGLTKSLQHEWAFIQRVIPDIAKELQPLQDTIVSSYLPNLFGTTFSSSHQYVNTIASLPIKHSGLSIHNPVSSSPNYYRDSQQLTSHLIDSLHDITVFSLPDHLALRKSVRVQIVKNHVMEYEASFDSITKSLPPLTRRILDRGKDTGQWLSVLPSVINDTTLASEEFKDGLHLRYHLTPPNLPARCDGCLAPFTVAHSLKCKIGGLIVQRHDEVANQLGQLCAQVFPKSALHAEPIIQPGYYTTDSKETTAQTTNQSTSTNSSSTTDNLPSDEREDLLIRGFWRSGTDCIIDVRLTDTDQPSYLSKTPFEILEIQEEEKKRKYSKKCCEQRRNFTPFVISVDGMIGKEAKSFLKHLGHICADKWDITYSKVRGYLNAKISIACLRAAHRCLRGSRVPSTRICRNHLPVEKPWEDGAGIDLFHTD